MTCSVLWWNSVLMTKCQRHWFEFPCSWCEGVVNPIYKQNSRLDPENYRRITISCALGKLFEIILNDRLTHAKKILQKEDPHQFGFKGKSRAIDCAFNLNGVIDICAGRKIPLYACFVDFRSTFDMVNRHARNAGARHQREFLQCC